MYVFQQLLTLQPAHCFIITVMTIFFEVVKQGAVRYLK